MTSKRGTGEPNFFDDADPEDAWSRSDTVVEQLHNLLRRLDIIEKQVNDTRVKARVQRLREDLLYVKLRVRLATINLFGNDDPDRFPE